MKRDSIFESNHRILIVDDNPAIHEDIRKILIGSDDSDLARTRVFFSMQLRPPP